MLDKIARALEELIYPRYCLLCHKKIGFADNLNDADFLPLGGQAPLRRSLRSLSTPQAWGTVSPTPPLERKKVFHTFLRSKKMALEESRDLVCAECIATIRLNTPPFCHKCGRKIPQNSLEEALCQECSQTKFYFDRAWASCPYEAAVKEMIHKFKYNNKIGLEKQLAQLMIRFTQDYHLPVSHCDYIIPIPLSSAKLREREFNQAEMLADSLAIYFNLKMLDNNLVRLQNTAPQANLDKAARWRNIQGAFRLNNPEAVQEKTVLLIDDVLTTGATASEAAKILKDAGADSVFVLTVAH